MTTIYDNPKTWRREIWDNQMLVQYMSEELISDMMRRDPKEWPPETAFCPGRIEGPTNNLPAALVSKAS